MRRKLRYKHSFNELLNELDGKHPEYSHLLAEKIISRINTKGLKLDSMNRSAYLKPALLFVLIVINVFTLLYFHRTLANNEDNMDSLKANFRKEFGISDSFESSF